MQNSLALTINQVCAATGLGRTKIYALIESGQLKARKIGRRTLVLRKDIERFLEESKDYKSGGHDAGS